MQAVILAAGRGSRILKYTDEKPKGLLEINKKSILEWQLLSFKKNRIEDITMVVGYKNQLIKKKLIDWKIKYAINPFYQLTNVLGSFWFALDYLHDDFIFVHGDTIFEEKILRKLLETKGDIVLAVEERKCEEEEMKIKLKNGRITEINKTMNPNTADGEFIGLAKINKELIPQIRLYTEKILEEGKHSSFFETVIQEVINSKKASVVSASITGLKWNEIDFEEDYKYAQKIFGRDDLL